MKRFTILIMILSTGWDAWGQTQTNKLEQTGKVGIGTTTPVTNLHIPSDGATIGQGSLENSFLLIGSTTNGIGLDDNEIFKLGNDLYLGTGDQSALRLRTNSKDVLYLSSGGNVAIGTITPDAKLHVSSGTSGDAVILVESDTNNNNESDNPSLQLRQDGGQVTGVIGLNGDAESEYDGALTNALYLENTNTGHGIQLVSNNTAQLTVLPSGKIGIGTTTPQSKLDVAGTIRATEIKVEAQTADYVFGDNYPLRDLDQVETFIKEHKHLPDIPGAKEMKASGINMAEMNKLLLQKIEELTLYAIEQQAIIKSQGEELNKKDKEVEELGAKLEGQEKRLTKLEALLLEK